MIKSVMLCYLLILITSSFSNATIINIPGEFADIQTGINTAGYGDTVLVQPGIYNENLDLHSINFTLASMYLLTGDASYISSTIIDGNQNGRVIHLYHHDSTTVIAGFTIQNGKTIQSVSGGGIGCLVSNPTIMNNIIRNNNAHGVHDGNAAGGGIYCDNSSAKIINNRIYGNRCSAEGTTTSASGGGIFLTDACTNTIIANNIIHDNRLACVHNRGGGIDCGSTLNTTIRNNVIYNNNREGIYGFDSDPIITNSVIWNNNIFFGDSSEPIITYSNIQNGWEGEGNIDEDPLFRDPENGDFHLMAAYCNDPYDSPCIDMGDPSIFDSYLDCNWGLGAERSDMGAYGGDRRIPTDIDNDISILPNKFILYQNFPNPFNPITTIQFSLPLKSKVQIEVFNLAGQRVAILIDDYQSAGIHSIIWDGSEYSSGIYFYRLTDENKSITKRMTLLK
ncbi:MAG: T9SS type A sorting domain-containing protein [candidate division Zixibacteria bacterium]|nr:T9SS type A sorting domain-containing protein [candidate division Zixibacteria bacterium]